MSKTYVTATATNVRLSYPHLFDKNPMTDKYSVQLLIPKSEEKTVKRLQKAIKQAEKLGKDKYGERFKMVNNPLHDGDGQKPRGGDYPEECHGHYVMEVKSNDRPEVYVGRDQLVAEEEDVKPGDWASVNVTFSPYDFNGNKGVGAYLDGVWKTKTGERLGGGKPSAKKRFNSIDLDEIDFGDDVDPITGLPLDDDELPF